MTTQLYLKSSKRTIPIEVKQTATGLLFWEPNRPDVVFEIGSGDAVGLLSKGKYFGGRMNTDVLSMTPLQILDYFRQSAVLSVHADDVADTFAKLGLIAKQRPQDSPQQNLQLQQDVQAIEHLCEPSQADVAEALFGDRGKTGGSYRRRILAALAALKAKTTTTTSPKQQEMPVVEKKAA